jgi:HPt (histidine-containing phosphotransfer) domain-containing protein
LPIDRQEIFLDGRSMNPFPNRVMIEPAADTAAVNLAEVRVLRSSLGDDADRIIALFLAETAGRLDRMAKLGAGERQLLAREAHSLKSAAATFGCTGLAHLALALEDEAAALELLRLPERIAVLAHAFEDARTALLERTGGGA